MAPLATGRLGVHGSVAADIERVVESGAEGEEADGHGRAAAEEDPERGVADGAGGLGFLGELGAAPEEDEPDVRDRCEGRGDPGEVEHRREPNEQRVHRVSLPAPGPGG
ncbi:MAG: hypothetical protein AAGI30_08530 [Planctomycetota bacterium]